MQLDRFFVRMSMGLSILGVSALAGMAVYIAQRPAALDATDPAFTIGEPELEITTSSSATAYEPAPDVDVAEAAAPNDPPRIPFAFTATVDGATYIELPFDGDLDVFAHGKGKLVIDGYITAAIAKVKPSDLPKPLRALAGTTIVVGDDGCTAKIDGFAYIARLTGDPGYAGIDGDSAKWTTASAYEHGSKMLAAKLDRACKGAFARDASLAPLPAANAVIDPSLLAEARADLYASDAAKTADAQWSDKDMWGEPPTTSWRDETPASLVVEHGETHERWVVIHAHLGGGCGERGVNLLGIYRRATGGTLVRVFAGQPEFDTFEGLIDVDGDGVFELRTSGWMGPDHGVQTIGGETLFGIDVPFFGCPC